MECLFCIRPSKFFVLSFRPVLVVVVVFLLLLLLADQSRYFVLSLGQ